MNTGIEESGKIFVGGIARQVDEGILTSYFGQFGNVVLASVMRDKFGVSRGFGFVAFDPPAVAKQVLQRVHVIEGRTIEIKQAMKHDRVQSSESSRPGGFGPIARGAAVEASPIAPGTSDEAIYVNRQVYVGGLPFAVQEGEVREYFTRFGSIVSINLKYDYSQNPPKFRGFGFVNFAEESSVEKCLEQYSSHQLGGKWIEVKRSKHSHVVQSENSGQILPQLVSGSGRVDSTSRKRGLEYDYSEANRPADQSPGTGRASYDPYMITQPERGEDRKTTKRLSWRFQAPISLI